MYKAPAKEELSADDKIVANMGGSLMQIRAHAQMAGVAFYSIRVYYIVYVTMLDYVPSRSALL